MLMYNLFECSHNYAKKSAGLCQHCRDEPSDDDITDSRLFRFTDNTNNVGTANVKIVVPLKCLRVFFGELLKCYY